MGFENAVGVVMVASCFSLLYGNIAPGVDEPAIQLRFQCLALARGMLALAS